VYRQQKTDKNITSNKHERMDNMNKRKFLIFMSLILALAALPWAVDIAQAGDGGAASGIPTYYANSPAPSVTSVASVIGNPLIARTTPTDTASNVFVVNPTALPAGTLRNFQTLDQPGSGTNSFHAYILRPTGVANQYTVVFDSGPLTVPAVASNSVRTYSVTPFNVLANDVAAFYGQGIPIDIGVGTDIVCYPAPAAPTAGSIITVGGAGYPLFVQPRTYSFSATVSVVTVGAGGMRKFVDTLPNLCGPAGTPIPTVTGGNGTLLAGKCIPVANPRPSPVGTEGTTVDYYEIGLVEYTEFMHADLPKATKLRGYVQLNDPANPVTVSGGHVTSGPQPHYLGPVIVAAKDKPVRIKFSNLLPTGAAGDLFLPVDTTYMGAGDGPLGGNELYTQTRAIIHLHGGFTPWISDGTPHQWITPAGETMNDLLLGHPATPTSYKVGVSARDVPDMNPSDPVNYIPSGGSVTLYYTNQQSGRLMFYHDHAYGMTRLNVYAGMAAGYLLTDPNERALTTGIPEIPLVIQDKTFVPTDIAVQDSKWNTTKWGQPGDLWFPHVYETNQAPFSNTIDKTNPVGRWDYGPWFWPIFPVANPILPDPSGVPEAFMDTMVVNGTAYPTATVEPKAYRLRILSAGNDRFLNLQLYQADPTITTGPGVGKEVKMLPAVPHSDNFGNPIATADGLPPCYPGVKSGLPNFVTDLGGGTTVTNPASGCWPDTWPMDGRDGGVPDPRHAGPDFIVIGSEGGLLPAPAVVPTTPMGYEYARRSVTVLNVFQNALLLGPAERADVIVDFSQYAGKTLILYNDAPAPVPAFDPRIDYYTGDPDQTANGGAPTTQPGFGPNTRTIMQIVVSGTPAPYTGCAPFVGFPSTLDCTTLAGSLATAYAATQERPIVGQTAYNAAFGMANTDQYAFIFTGSSLQPTWTFTDGSGVNQTAAVPLADGSLPPGATIPLLNKAIQELFDPVYGRMNATLGVELPFTSAITQTTIPLGYIDPVTETVPDGQTQIWKITHNGVDTHAIHFHLVNVQVINRVGWDGTVKPPADFEVGWKETVRMNPLEDIYVAARGKSPKIPFTLPNSVRAMDPTQPMGPQYTAGFTQVDPATGNPAVVYNQLADFGWEYVWHCHLLGHEENDMMRPLVLANATGYNTADHVAPTVTAAPNTLAWKKANVTVTITAVDGPPAPSYLASGVASITYSATGAQPIASTTVPGSTASVVISTQGSTTISYSATDKAATPNASATQTDIVNLDKTAPTVTAATNPLGTTRSGQNVVVTVSGTVTDQVGLSGVNTAANAGTYTMTDSKSATVVNGTFTVAANGTYSFTRTISRQNTGANNVANRRIYTFTVRAPDTAGNIGSTTTTFYVQ
jgi:FtsP/CotA-like multicopper oxidase with cupredoxin domain